MSDSDDIQAQDTPTDGAATHPLQRAHKFFLKAAPAIREVHETIERHGGLDQVREKVVERVGEVVKQVDEVVANATAIEGEVIERDEPVAPVDATTRSSDRPTPRVTPVPPPGPSPKRWIALGVVAAAATYGALRFQRRS